MKKEIIIITWLETQPLQTEPTALIQEWTLMHSCTCTTLMETTISVLLRF